MDGDHGKFNSNDTLGCFACPLRMAYNVLEPSCVDCGIYDTHRPNDREESSDSNASHIMKIIWSIVEIGSYIWIHKIFVPLIKA
jgi:hypothetical protein